MHCFGKPSALVLIIGFRTVNCTVNCISSPIFLFPQQSRPKVLAFVENLVKSLNFRRRRRRRRRERAGFRKMDSYPPPRCSRLKSDGVITACERPSGRRPIWLVKGVLSFPLLHVSISVFLFHWSRDTNDRNLMAGVRQSDTRCCPSGNYQMFAIQFSRFIFEYHRVPI